MSETTANEIGFAAMSVQEFARSARLGESSVWKAIREHRLDARKAGRRTLILMEDGKRFLRELPPARQINV